MADIFKKDNANFLLNGKHILFIGDSNIRALYKDLIWLYKINNIIELSFLKRRLEESFLGDKLLHRSELTRGRDFTEHRIFEDGRTKIEFLFVTKCYCDNIIKMVEGIKNDSKNCPDVILMNSCLWDVSRWGPNGVNEYKTNMEKLMKLFSTSLPKHVLFIWATALPIATLTTGGLLIKQIEFLQEILQIHVIEANAFTAALVSSYEFDVLDFHHYMRYQIIRRSADGIHFLPTAMRFLTNLLLTHISMSWDVKLPANLKNFKYLLAGKIENAIRASTGTEVEQIFKKIGQLADTLGTPKKKKIEKLAKKKQNIIQEAVLNEANPKHAQYKTTDSQKTVLKTPPYYHKGYPIPSKRLPNHQYNLYRYCNFQNDNFQNYNKQQKCSNYQNADSAQIYNNFGVRDRFTVNRSPNVNDLNHLQFPLKDFRIMTFNDYHQSRRSSESFDFRPGYSQPNTIDYSPMDHSRVFPEYSNNYGHYSRYDSNFCTNYYIQPNAENLFNVSKTIINNKVSKLANPNYYDRFSFYKSHPYKSSQGGWKTKEEREFYQQNPGPMRWRRSSYYSRRQ